MAEESVVRVPLRPCVQCGKPVVTGMKECFVCGTPIDENGNHSDQPPRCPTCGKELTQGVMVCSLCGTRQSVREPSSGKRTANSSSSVNSQRIAQNSVTLLSTGLASRLGMSLGTVTFLLLGFFLGKLLLTSSGSKPSLKSPPSLSAPTDMPSPELPASSPALAPAFSSSVHVHSAEVSVSPVSSIQNPTSPLLQGQVVTAEQLLPIRTFGAGAKEPARTVARLRSRVEEFLPSLQNLYNEKLAATTQLLGAVVIEFTIMPEGAVSEVRCHTTALESFLLLQLVQNLVQEWQFEPVLAGETVVFYPLLFIPQTIDPVRLIDLTKEHLPGRYRLLGTEPLAVRSSRSEEAAEVGKVSPGLRFDVVGAQGEWLTILSPKGKTGYVHHAAIAARVEDDQPQS